jgi:UDP-N-acetyl-2-amino-2-deoxyglucuronate dehydrogenase
MNKRFAIVGCGRIAQRHAAQIQKLGTLVAVCDVDVDKCNEMATAFNTVPYYTLEQLLAKEKNIDLISICTPNGLHAQHSIVALKNGVNVLCEKPLCIRAEDGEKMVAEAIKSNRALFVVKQNRYNPPIEFLKTLLVGGKLGKIYSFQINCFWNRPEAYYSGWKGSKLMDGGTLYTQFSHFIDLMYWLLGEVADVTAVFKNQAHKNIEFEDCGAVSFTMKSGAIGTLNYTVNSFLKNMEGSLTVFGEKGTVKVGGQYLNELEYCHIENVQTPELPKGNPANAYGYYQGSMSNHDKVYENVLLALSDTNHSIATGEDGLKTVEIIEMIYKAKN